MFRHVGAGVGSSWLKTDHQLALGGHYPVSEFRNCHKIENSTPGIALVGVGGASSRQVMLVVNVPGCWIKSPWLRFHLGLVQACQRAFDR